MPKTLDLDLGDGVPHKKAYVPDPAITLVPGKKLARVAFDCYVSKAAYDGGKTKPIVGASRAYTAQAAKFDQYFGAGARGSVYENAWKLAVATVEGPPPPPGAQDTRTSLFADAEDA